VAAALGVATGVLVHTTAAALGLAALLRTSALAFTAVKYAGAAYLVVLGARTLWAGGDLDALAGTADDGSEADADAPAPDLRRGYRRGLVVNVLNPKVALFFLALLPQFVDAGAGATAGMVALGATYAALAALYLGGVGLLSGHVRAALRGRPRVADGLRWASGTVLVGLGAALAVESA